MQENVKRGRDWGFMSRRVIAYVVLVIISFLCLFWFYVLFINATRSNSRDLTRFLADPRRASAAQLDGP